MRKRLNKFEQTRILSARALELAEGALPKTKLGKDQSLLSKDYVKVARKELEENKLDLEIYLE